MPKFIRRLIFNRDLRIARETKVSLDHALVARSTVDGRVWPVDAQYLDSEIDRLQAKLDALLTKLNKPEFKEFHVAG